MDNTSRQPSPEQVQQLERIGSLCLCANLRRASRAITSLYDQFLQPSGLLATQFILLAALGGQAAIALTPLSEKLGMDPTTLARNLKPLERDGLVQILSGADRRTRVLSLTPRGQDRLALALPLWAQAQTAVISQLGAERAQIMLGDWLDIVSLSRP